MFIISAILTALVPVRVELNHVYGIRGQLVMDQLIFWDWDGERFELVGSRTLSGVRGDIDAEEKRLYELNPEKYPPPVPAWLGHRVVYFDYKLKRYACEGVVATEFRETWTWSSRSGKCILGGGNMANYRFVPIPGYTRLEFIPNLIGTRFVRFFSDRVELPILFGASGLPIALLKPGSFEYVVIGRYRPYPTEFEDRN